MAKEFLLKNVKCASAKAAKKKVDEPAKPKPKKSKDVDYLGGIAPAKKSWRNGDAKKDDADSVASDTCAPMSAAEGPTVFCVTIGDTTLILKHIGAIGVMNEKALAHTAKPHILRVYVSGSIQRFSFELESERDAVKDKLLNLITFPNQSHSIYEWKNWK